jgi:hypothetical protein
LNLSGLISELLDKKSFVFPPESEWLIKKLLFLYSLIVAMVVVVIIIIVIVRLIFQASCLEEISML